MTGLEWITFPNELLISADNSNEASGVKIQIAYQEWGSIDSHAITTETDSESVVHHSKPASSSSESVDFLRNAAAN